jgi:hypothetical protein
VEVAAVTNIRASNDYAAGLHPQWMIGHSSIFAHALGLAPSKDGYWSAQTQADSPWPGRIEPFPRLQSAVAHYSRGPVAFADRAGAADAALVRMHCDADGRLLRATVPATAVDATFLRLAGLGRGPEGELWSAYSETVRMDCGGGAWRYEHILAANLAEPYAVRPADLRRPPKAASNADCGGGAGGKRAGAAESLVQFAQPAPGVLLTAGDVTEFSAASPFAAQACGQADFQLVHVAPVLPNGWVVLGETAKWVPVSPDRFSSIAASGSGPGVAVALVGGARENVTVTFQDPEGAVAHASCALQEDGRGVITMPQGTCTP